LILQNNHRTFGRFVNELLIKCPTDPIRVLDVGCGNKPWAAHLAAQLPTNRELQYIGTDFSTAEAAPDALSLGDALPFPDSTFDAVILSEVLEHCPRPRDVVAECRRILRSGGVLFISTPFVFYEHGVPFDFQRPTRYFYRDVFAEDDIILMSPSNSTYSTALTTINLAVETTPLRLLPILPGMLYVLTNILAIATDSVIKALGPMLMRSWQDVFFTMPLGYSLVVRLNKTS
jgi:SAM-dependent methyltransferase